MSKRLSVVAVAIGMMSCYAAAAPPIDPGEARPDVCLRDAKQVVGRVACVSGRVADVRTAGRITFLDFGDELSPTFVGVIHANNLSAFSETPIRLYTGKILRVHGFVSSFRGGPQITITSPDQVEVLTSLPEFEKPAEGPRWEEQSTFRFATFNTLNLFDDADNPYSWDEATPAKPRRQLEALAKTIRHLNADVVALEEVENRGYLERFLEVFLPDLGYEHVVEFDGNDDRGINVALISRIPVGEVRSNRHVEFPGPDGKPMRFARDVLNVTLQPSPTQSIQIWIVHLLSNFQGRDYAERYRVAEAREIRELLDEELDSDANARIVVAGDFNDTWGSETLRTVIGTGSTALWSTSLDCHESSPITYNQKPYLSMIDFILCSPAMKYQYVKGSYRVEPGSPDESGSDHNPVVVEFNTKPVIEVSSR